MSTLLFTPFRWPLAIPSWTLGDKLRIARWVLRSDRYTMGPKVEELEEKFSQFSGRHALMVANGSVANQLVFELWKLKHPGVTPVVICPAVTWVSSISPAMMAGCEVVFCDVNLQDFSLDYDACERLVENYTAKGRQVILWPTALIGFAPNMERLRRMARKHGADLYLDSCENTFSQLRVQPVGGDGSYVGPKDIHESILASADMTTTSLYLSHQVSSVEGGFVFFRHKIDYDRARMFRNHGLSRSLPPDHLIRLDLEQSNPSVDPQFLFAQAGTNLRPTDVHAMFGLADFTRVQESIAHRNRLYHRFHEQLDRSAYYLPPLSDSHVGFCFPIITLRNEEMVGDRAAIRRIKRALTDRGIEVRPLIGGNLLYQPPFQPFGRPQDFPNADWLHWKAAYVGLHLGVTEAMVDELTSLLNELAETVSQARLSA